MKSKEEFNFMCVFVRSLFSVIIFAVVSSGCADKTVPVEKAKVIKSYPHNSSNFTQGLFFSGGNLCESTGIHGKSSFYIYEFPSMRLKKKTSLPGSYFGEGAVMLNKKLFWLTYETEVCLMYDAKTLKFKKIFRYVGEGWGLTHDGENLIMSNGSSILFYRDPETFAIERRLEVKDGGRSLPNLNELEYIDGKIYANIWMSPYIAVIDADTGNVLKKIDLSELIPEEVAGNIEAVANGIAYEPKSKNLLVTGKLWPKMFLIKL